jgi:hypothetical protein
MIVVSTPCAIRAVGVVPIPRPLYQYVSFGVEERYEPAETYITRAFFSSWAFD